MRQHRLYLKPEKCFFEESEVQFLGVIVGNGQLRTDPEKVKAVAEWKVPRNKKELQSFLGFLNFYRRFIRDFSKIAKPLHILMGKQDWYWDHAQQKAFDDLKVMLC